MTRREAGYQYMHTLIFIVPRRLTNVAADKHFSDATSSQWW